MTSKEELKKRLHEASVRSAAAADRELAGELDLIRQANTVDLEALKPKLSDSGSFDALVNAVQEATALNESIVQLRNRVKALGDGVVRVAKEAANLLKP